MQNNIKEILKQKHYKGNLNLRKTDITSLGQLLGKAMANSIKEQLGQETEEPVSKLKRKGQMGLSKF